MSRMQGSNANVNFPQQILVLREFNDNVSSNTVTEFVIMLKVIAFFKPGSLSGISVLKIMPLRTELVGKGREPMIQN